MDRPVSARVEPDEWGRVTLIDHRPDHYGSRGMVGFSMRLTSCGCPTRRVGPDEVPSPRSDVDRHDHTRYGYTTAGYVGELGHGPVLTCRCPGTTPPDPAEAVELAAARAVAAEMCAAVLAGDGLRIAALVGAESPRRVEVGDALDELVRLLSAQAAALLDRDRTARRDRMWARWVRLTSRWPT